MFYVILLAWKDNREEYILISLSGDKVKGCGPERESIQCIDKIQQ